jgi:3-deoxy-D-manno-octulosonic-acid transferase
MLYYLAIYIYMFGVSVAALWNKKARLMFKGRWNTFRILHKEIKKDEKYIWFHAASLGEFEQGRPLMERIRAQHPEYKILLTFFSPSGYEVRKNYKGADVICYLPFDTPGNIHSFMRLAHPSMVIFIKYEFWGGILKLARKKRLPIYNISCIFRENQIFFRWYGGKYRKVLRCFDHFFVQNQVSKDLLEAHNIKNVTVTGDTRFDRVLDIMHQAKELPIVEQFKRNAQGASDRVFIVGSSWGPDEDIYIPFFNAHPEYKLIIAPHEIHEGHLAEIEHKLKMKSVRYTQANESNIEEARCLIIDCFGLLSSIYRYGEVAYIGGGFGVGIHNVPEAAVYGIPVMFGPNNKRFMEAQALLSLGGATEITSRQGFEERIHSLLTQEEERKRVGEICRKYIQDNAGATDKIYSMLDFSRIR